MSQAPSNEERIFQAARAIADTESREAYVQSACGDDAVLLARIFALLKLDSEPASYLESPLAELGETTTMPRLTERPGDEIGPYKLLQQIGEGGFGVVYMAEQTRPIRRKVALKIIKPGMDTREVIARFEAERQALALMDHPNIAKVLDGGATNSGRPYFVMELVKGIPLTRFCDENRLDTRQRLALFASVCKAIQHAHHKGVIHRDIKPSNVMITLHDSLPVPKVIDFGVSKAITQQLTEKTLFTAYGQMIGTPQYMSPEQAEMSGLDIDTRSDIYSLGVLLYELLTGATPLDVKSLRGKAFAELQRLIREAVPQKPSHRLSTQGEATVSVAASRNTDPQKLSALLRGELDWIVLKALDKDRNRRYETANDFAHDVERYLRNESVLACPPTFAYRLRKTVRRNRTAMLVTTTLFLTLISGLAASLWQYGDAVTQRKRAEMATQDALDSEKESLDRLAQVQRAEQIKDEALAAQSVALIRSEALRLTAQSSAVLPTNPGLALLLAIEGAKRLPDLAPANNALVAAMLNCREVRTFLHGEGYEVQAVEIRPDGSRVLGIEHTRILVWDTHSGSLISKIDPQSRVQNIRAKFSPDGRHFAMFSEGVAHDQDKNGVSRGFTDRVIRIWDSSTGLETLVLRGHTDRVTDVCYSRDGTSLLTASWDRTARLWNTITGENLKTLSYGQSINSAVFSPNEDRVLAIAENQSASSTILWDGAEDIKPTIIDPPLSTSDFFDPAGDGVSSSGGYNTEFITNDDPIAICSVLATGEVVSAFKFKEKSDPVAAAYLSNGKHAVIKFLNVITMWEVDSGKLLFECNAQQTMEGDEFRENAWHELAFIFLGKRKEFFEKIEDRPVALSMLTGWSTDAKGLVAATGVGSPIAVTWTMVPHGLSREFLIGHEGNVNDVKFSSDGQRIFSAGDDTVRMWDVRAQLPYLELNEQEAGPHVVMKTNTVAFSPVGNRIAAGSEDGSTQLFDANTGHRLATLKPKIEWPDYTEKPKVFNIPDIFGHLFDAPPEPKHGDSMFGEIRLVRFSSDGKRLVTLSDDMHAKVKLGDQPDSPAQQLPFKPAKIWDASTFEPICACPGNVFDFSKSDVSDLRLEYSTGFDNATFTPDSKNLVTCDAITDNYGTFHANGRLGPTGNRSLLWSKESEKIIGPFLGVKSWDATNGQLIKSIVSDLAGELSYISDDGLRALIPMQNGPIVVDPIDGSTICRLNDDPNHSLVGAQFSENLNWLLTLDGGPVTLLWDLATGNTICQIYVDHPINGESNSQLKRDPKVTVPVADRFPQLAKFGAKSARLVTTYTDNSADLWEIPSGEHVASLVGHTKSITCVEFSPDGKWIVTGSTDGTARVWNAENGREYVAFPNGEITAVAFGPDSQRIVTASTDGTARIWQLDLLALAKSKAPRELTAAERIRFEIEPTEPSMPSEMGSVDSDRK